MTQWVATYGGRCCPRLPHAEHGELLPARSAAARRWKESLGREGWGAAAVTSQCKGATLLVQMHDYLWCNCNGLAGKRPKQLPSKMWGCAVRGERGRSSHAAARTAGSRDSIHSHLSTRAHCLGPALQLLDRLCLFLRLPWDKIMTSWMWSLPSFCFSCALALSSLSLLLW